MRIFSSIKNIALKSSQEYSNTASKKKSNSSFIHLTKDGTITNVSDDFCKMILFHKDEIKGKHINSIIDEKSHQEIISLIKDLSADLPFHKTKVKIIDSIGNIINTELFLTLTTLKDNAPVFAIFRKSGTHQDMYEELFEKKQKLKLLSDNTNHVQILYDKDFKCLFLSKSCYALSGYHYHELLDHDLYNLIHPNDFVRVWEHINSRKNYKKDKTIVCRFKHKDGCYKWIEARIVTICDQFNSISHYAVYIHDATSQIKKEQEITRAKEQVEIASKLKTQFLNNVSHELRTPLNSIIGFSKILTTTLSDPRSLLYTKLIEESGNQLLEMVNNILCFSELEKKKLSVKSEYINIGNFFMELKNYTEKAINKSNKQLELIVKTDLYANDKTFYTDKEILEQIFLNLINNANKFTKTGYIKFGCKPYGINNYLFYVEDTGIGIPQEFHQKIFNSLTQKDSSLTREHGGVGIGLSITKKLVSLLNGQIWVMSEDSAGSAFYFTLPNTIRNKKNNTIH